MNETTRLIILAEFERFHRMAGARIVRREYPTPGYFIDGAFFTDDYILARYKNKA